MTNKAIITSRGSGVRAAIELAAGDEDRLGVAVEQELETGTLVSGPPEQLEALEDSGFRVKLLRDTNLLTIGDHVIDIESADQPEAAAVADNDHPAGPDGPEWTHFLVQCVAPPTEEWVRSIQARGVDVVEPVSAYGLFVVGSAERVADLADLSFIAWTGPFRPEYRIAPEMVASGGVGPVAIMVYPVEAAPSVAASIDLVVDEQEENAAYGGTFAIITAELDAGTAVQMAANPHVRWIEPAPPLEPLGEREAQILAENLDGAAPPNTGPVTGYQTWLAGLSLSGAGTTVAIVDTGVDANADNNTSGHTDLRGRQAAFVDYTGGLAGTDTNGHGTHVAGIAVGNAATGQAEGAAPDNFLWGQGIAPAAGYVTQNYLAASPQPAISTLIQDSAGHGAQVMNNSWGINNSPGSGYTTRSRVIDRGVRDPNSAAAGLEYLVVVCAAGNDGGADSSVSDPHETKNDIVVGNSLTRRPNNGFAGDDIRGIAGSSSRGPAVDGRILPTVVAPGTDVTSALSRTAARQPIPGTGVPDPINPATMIDQYLSLSGTSMAAPAVTGACALLIEWWRASRSGQNPSPALLKALLVNGAEDLAGGQNWRALNRTDADRATWTLESGSVFRRSLTFIPAAVLDGSTLLTPVGSVAAMTSAGRWFFEVATHRLFVRTVGSTSPGAPGVPTVTVRESVPLANIPNGHQGWGRVSLENILLQAPASDRGPRIFTDQAHAFTAAGQEQLIKVAPHDTGRPLRITLAWTDAPAAVGSNPALVNDLDLEVTDVATGQVFKGNVFSGGFSVPGGSFDDRNNVECVYLARPSGVYEVRVIAASITAPARPDLVNPWQDYVLVLDNAEVPPTAPVAVVPVLDRSGSMVAYGFVDTTRESCKQFVGVLGIDDKLGVVSFGDDGRVEFPPASPSLATITGQPIRDDAAAAIDAISFGGCTFMGDGIVKARDLLAGGTGERGIVLFSDGYDNKGCDLGNPLKPSAVAAAATLPSGVALHTCAMGPAADQTLLEQLAGNGGQYYYMPTIDDLFEIYNYVRGQVTGDAISVIASATASRSRMAVQVDALATTATFTVGWTDRGFRFVPSEPRKEGEVSIRLRDPRGRLLHPNASQVQLLGGDSFIAFRLHDPAPGQWHVEVETVSQRHLRYTVGGFCSSPLNLEVAAIPRRLSVGEPIRIGALVRVGKDVLSSARMSARVIAPAASLGAVLDLHRDKLSQVEPPKDLMPDFLPDDIARMATLRRKLLNAGQPDPFGTVASRMPMRSVNRDQLTDLGLGDLFDGAPAGGGMQRATAGSFSGTSEAGSYNVIVKATGIDLGTGARFTRQGMASVVVR